MVFGRFWVTTNRDQQPQQLDENTSNMANDLGDEALSEEMAAYNQRVEQLREHEYPMLKDSTYLDHAGTTLYSKTQMDRFHSDMMSNLYGNPHSASPSSQHSTVQIENIRLDLLRFFKADPAEFDLVFTANATAGIKLVMEAFREQDGGFWYGYHVDSHTSLIGLREAAKNHRCFGSDEEVESWIEKNREGDWEGTNLVAYPAQSNMNGRRLPLDWCKRIRMATAGYNTYTLLDAAAYATTSPLDLSVTEAAPDFTVLSLYKIFGFPDLGALIVRKSTAPLFQKRRYFGGGTVDMVVCLKEEWYAKKSGALHSQLEDGTLPVHNIIALRSAMQTHKELFDSLETVSRHTAFLAKQLHDGLASLKHGNNKAACTIYKHRGSTYGVSATQGPTVAFNLRDSDDKWVSTAEIEKLATIQNIHLRTGGLCNPGGIATSLGLAPWEMRDNFSAGHRCGSENDIINGKPTGMVRVSLGAMSTASDVERFLTFIEEFFVDKSGCSGPPSPLGLTDPLQAGQFHVESLSVYPIKSCAGWQIPYNTPWEIRREGLAWDREWCVVHEGTGAALSQKRYPRMALVRPALDFTTGKLRIRIVGEADEIDVPLSMDPTCFDRSTLRGHDVSVCGEAIQARIYNSPTIAEFFTQALGTPCTLARFPAASSMASARHSKPHLQPRNPNPSSPPRPLLLSNESPILTITRSSLNRLNEQIKATGSKTARAAHPSAFRANIVLAESPALAPGQEQPWAEDGWARMRIGGLNGANLELLGGCRRCQMVCVDQETGERRQEPFVTLAKIRRIEGRVLFGVHGALVGGVGDGGGWPRIRAGDAVKTVARDE